MLRQTFAVALRNFRTNDCRSSHRTTTPQEMEAFQRDHNKLPPDQVEIRVKEIAEVYEKYIETIAEFDHVLLNTNFRAD